MLTAWPMLALLACEPTPQQEVGETPLEGSWIAQVVRDPAAFTQVVDADREAWIALHRSDLPAAAAGGGPAALRARWELADLYADLGRLSALAWQSTAATWESRTGIPKGSALPWFAALAAGELGAAERAGAWLDRAGEAADPAVRRAAAWLADGAEGPPPADNPLVERWLAHAAARDGGEAGALREWAASPLLSERGEGGARRDFYDPQALWTLAERTRPDPEALPEGLEGLLFSGCLDGADLEAERRRLAGGGAPGSLCMRGASWEALGLDPLPGAEDDPERARATVRALDRALDPWAAALAESAGEGRELLDQLGLVPLLRSRALLAMARGALEAEHPRQALALAQLALDLEHPRDLSPVNAPGLFAVLAEAKLLTGHSREALDALQVLVDAYPEAAGVDEIVGDLAILQAMDRRGDSKEH